VPGELVGKSARELRADGATLTQIAADLGITVRQVRKALDPAAYARAEREQNRRRHAAKREWERRDENRLRCEACGGPRSESASGVCVRCLCAGREFREAWSSDLRAGGAINTEIADIVGGHASSVPDRIGSGSPYDVRDVREVAHVG
jgi:hypothetical protein